ncbi:Protein apaG [Senna tora]|uniref:Protein apaG n=1 Tax=Senna tora TaxID=362788 RepID=A0A834X6G7_9FABA|nr:Protein apaG [Senna tora]
MQSLSVKAFVDLRLPAPGGSGFGFGESETGVRRLCVNSRSIGRRNGGIIACAAAERNGNGRGESRSMSQSPSSTSSSSFLSRTHSYALLKQQLEVAARSEDYKEAARIRDSLKLFEEEEPVLRLRRLIKEAVADERFKDAARYRDELKEIAPHSLLKCSSDATTLGIRVQVRSVYIEGRSQPSKGQYFFAYRIRITNNSDHPVQLIRRHWIITDGNGKTENVWGMGVVGEQPVILPRTGFEYSSACPLCTPSGRMEGDFEMIHVDRPGSRSFNVAIAPFSLSLLGDDDGHTI